MGKNLFTSSPFCPKQENPMKNLIVLLILAEFISTAAIGCATTKDKTQKDQKDKERCRDSDCD